ncbi:hypothetical protein FRC08_017699, partial [Ceratobasidium sp. 394]
MKARPNRPGPVGTSCLTCRHRRKKCDRTRPFCERCRVGGFACLGYDNWDEDSLDLALEDTKGNVKNISSTRGYGFAGSLRPLLPNISVESSPLFTGGYSVASALATRNEVTDSPHSSYSDPLDTLAPFGSGDSSSAHSYDISPNACEFQPAWEIQGSSRAQLPGHPLSVLGQYKMHLQNSNYLPLAPSIRQFLDAYILPNISVPQSMSPIPKDKMNSIEFIVLQ